MANTALSTTFKVGYRCRCTITAPLAERGSPSGLVPVSATGTWHPKPPCCLSLRELADYRHDRGALIAEICRMIDGNILVVETCGRTIDVMRPGIDRKSVV